MTRTEHLLTILTEECNEVAQRCTKALRFGLTEIQPGQPFTNAERIMREVADLIAALEMLENVLPVPPPVALINAKKEQVETYLEYSASLGMVEE